MVRQKKNRISRWFLAGITLIVLAFIAQKLYNRYIYTHSEASLTAVERTWLHYNEDVKKVSIELNLPADYLLALIALECSGMEEVPSRYESHIFNKLVKVREGDVENFEGIDSLDIRNSNDDALKNLASSWGPFQIMGYQCLRLDIKIKELRGSRSIFHGARWIKSAYGDYLEEKKFKDAFHLHNTGKRYPKVGPPRTHSRYYVPRGLKFMKEFAGLLAKNEI